MTNDKPIIECTFANEQLLYLAYMPFIKGGGLFARTKETYPLGTPVTLILRLLDDIELYETDAKVVWLTPKSAQGNKPAGVGLQLIGENSRTICNKIETYLAGMLKSTQGTDTI